MVLCNHRDFDYRKACFDAYNRWIACSTAARIPPAPRHRADGDALAGGRHPRPARDPRARAPRRDDARHAGGRGLRLARLRRLLPRRDRARAAAVVPHPDVAGGLTPSCAARGSTSSCRSSAAARTSWARSSSAASSSAIPRLRVVCVEADAGWVPHYMYRMDHAYDRHRYWLPAGPGALAAALRILPREHLYDLPGRLGRVPHGPPHELGAAHVGERLPAQRLDLALVAGDARRASAGLE
jgi:hypothetical protein